MKVKISKENWIKATTDIKGHFWCPIEKQEFLLNVWPNGVDIEIEVGKPKTKKVKKWNNSRKELADWINELDINYKKIIIEKLLATQPKPIKEESKDIEFEEIRQINYIPLGNNWIDYVVECARGINALIRNQNKLISLTKRNIK